MFDSVERARKVAEEKFSRSEMLRSEIYEERDVRKEKYILAYISKCKAYGLLLRCQFSSKK